MTGHFTSYENRTDHELATILAGPVAQSREMPQIGGLMVLEEVPMRRRRPSGCCADTSPM
jgi:hypothetical protein